MPTKIEKWEWKTSLEIFLGLPSLLPNNTLKSRIENSKTKIKSWDKPKFIGRPTPIPMPQPIPKPVNTCPTFKENGFSIVIILSFVTITPLPLLLPLVSIFLSLPEYEKKKKKSSLLYHGSSLAKTETETETETLKRKEKLGKFLSSSFDHLLQVEEMNLFSFSCPHFAGVWRSGKPPGETIAKFNL